MQRSRGLCSEAKIRPHIYIYDYRQCATKLLSVKFSMIVQNVTILRSVGLAESMSVKNIFFGYPALTYPIMKFRLELPNSQHRREKKSLSPPQGKNLTFQRAAGENFDVSVWRRRKCWCFSLPQAKILSFQPAASKNLTFQPTGPEFPAENLKIRTCLN